MTHSGKGEALVTTTGLAAPAAAGFGLGGTAHPQPAQLAHHPAILDESPPDARRASKGRGCSPAPALPQVLPQLVSDTLYRCENNIPAAAVPGVLGAGGLGPSLPFHMGMFHMGKTATNPGAMLRLAGLVDALSDGAQPWPTR